MGASAIGNVVVGNYIGTDNSGAQHALEQPGWRHILGERWQRQHHRRRGR